MGVLLMAGSAESRDWKLVIHGGAGVIERSKITPDKDAEIRAALAQSLDAGSKILESGGSALDAVEASVRVLEDDANLDRKSTRLNSSHLVISYAVFCLKKKNSKCNV